MASIRGLLSALFLANLACSSAWEYGARAREEPPSYGAWYQLPQPGPYPPPAYERAPPSSAYPGYPRPYSRSPDYYPDTPAVTNNMVPTLRKSPSGGYYPSIHASQDNSHQSAVDRYLPLLSRKKSTPRPSPDAASVMRTLQPRRPFVETWKCFKKPCKKTLPPDTVTQKPVTLKPRKWSTINISVINPSHVKSVPRLRVTPRPSQSKTFATVQGIRLESVRPYTFRPRHRVGPVGTSSSSSPSTTPIPESTTLSPKVDSTTVSVRRNSTLIPEEFPYSLLWPNAELIAAIKDVVRKFKHSLERSGVQDDVRQMGSQLETTWNDLRRGMQRSWHAFRQSAEGAILSPMTVSPTTVVDGYPYIITRQASPPAREEVKEKEKVLSTSGGPLSQILFQNLVFEPDDIFDSGKFDQWIERAHQVLADSATDPQAFLKSDSQPVQIPKEKNLKTENSKLNNPEVQQN